MSQCHETRRGGFDEWRGAADERQGALIRRPCDLTQHLGVDPAVIARPSRRLHAGQSVHHLKHRGALDQMVEFVAVDNVVKVRDE